jgi:hypothetical protein
MNRNYRKLRRVELAHGDYELDTKLNISSYFCLYVNYRATVISELNYGEAFNVSNDSAIRVNGTLILSDSLIIKGSNNRNYWSRPQADIDALNQFLHDSKESVNETSINEIRNKYICPLLLDRLQYGIKTKYYSNHPHDFYYDYNELVNMNFDNEIILANLWDEYKQIQLYEEPTGCENIINSWWYKALVNNITNILLGILITLLYGERRNSKNHLTPVNTGV